MKIDEIADSLDRVKVSLGAAFWQQRIAASLDRVKVSLGAAFWQQRHAKPPTHEIHGNP